MTIYGKHVNRTEQWIRVVSREELVEEFLAAAIAPGEQRPTSRARLQLSVI